MFRPAKKKEEEKKPEEKKPPEHSSNEKQQQVITRGGSGPRVTSQEVTYAGVAIDPRIIRLLTSLDIVTIDNLLNPHPISGTVTVDNLLDPHPVTQLTRKNLLTKPEREDLTSLGNVASPNNAGVQIIAGVTGQKIKVYDAGYHGAVDGLHYFYFGTSTTATAKRFCTMNLKGLVHKTFVQPRIGGAGDGLYLFSSVSETNMPYDVGYVQEA